MPVPGSNAGHEYLNALLGGPEPGWAQDYFQGLEYNGNGMHEVGLKRPNGFGLFDMLGNVQEWVSDWYGEDYYQNSPLLDPEGPGTTNEHIARGGSWDLPPRAERASFRLHQHIVDPSGVDCGFRCVQPTTEAQFSSALGIADLKAAELADYAKGKDFYQRGDYAHALPLISRQAEAGNAEAQYLLGEVYLNDRFLYEIRLATPQGYAKALEWLTKSAEQDNADAQVNVAYLYSQGIGMPQDYEKAFEWETKAAKQGSVAGETNLGLMYEKGLAARGGNGVIRSGEQSRD